MYLVADPGSTHFGEYKFAMEHITCAYSAGFNAVKFQLLESEHLKNGNIELPIEWLPKLIAKGKETGVDVFASVWSIPKMDLLKAAGATSCKLSYSAMHGNFGPALLDRALSNFARVYSTHSLMDYVKPKAKNHFPLWTITDSNGPIYPVTYNSNHILYTNQKVFSGFSCHNIRPTFDYKICKLYGAKVFEVHTRLNLSRDRDCADGRFAVSYQEWREGI